MLTKCNLLVITGPTASGKTTIASNIAYNINSEIISADSRQVYRKMDIGTGKDLEEYVINNKNIPFHLIDIADAGYKYNVYEFQKDFFEAYNKIISKDKLPILCGGTGLYINSIIQNYTLTEVPNNEKLRKELKDLSLLELEKILKSYKEIHNKSDLDTTKRAIRAIEIAEYYSRNKISDKKKQNINPLIVGVYLDRETRREKITQRLKYRLENGMIREAENLLKQGISHEDLEYYGLEYKYLSLYLSNKITYDELFSKLNTAIHQFAKRQMTWFRKMEKEGLKINWIDGALDLDYKINAVLNLLEEQND